MAVIAYRQAELTTQGNCIGVLPKKQRTPGFPRVFVINLEMKLSERPGS